MLAGEPAQTVRREGDLRVLIAGGGTGGHIIPGLAIARELRDAHGAEVRFVGTARGLETKLVPEAGFALELIHVGQLKNVSFATRAQTLGDLPRGIVRCASLLRRFRPHAVAGVGGYASGPAMLAAILLRLPTLAFEPNAAPGLANRLVGRRVSAAAVNFPETTRFFRNAKVTGIPVRPEFFAIGPKPNGSSQRLLIMGGSQGARALNEVLPKIAGSLLNSFPALTIVHQAGQHHAESTLAAYRLAKIADHRIEVFAFLKDAATAIAEADLVLCRSGAGTVAELCAAGRPALYVPFPRAADDHQRKNAEAMASAGAAEVLVESEMTPQALLQRLSLLLGETGLPAMALAAKIQARPDALEQIAQMVVSISDRHR